MKSDLCRCPGTSEELKCRCLGGVVLPGGLLAHPAAGPLNVRVLRTSQGQRKERGGEDEIGAYLKKATGTTLVQSSSGGTDIQDL